MSNSASSRNHGNAHYHLLDFLKILSASLIIFHHLAFYGPMADHVRPLIPSLADWLAGEARLAVQVFLVVGGFLAARSLAPLAESRARNPLPAIFSRYVKLAPPFFIATLLAVLAAEITRGWMTHDSISPLPHWQQLAAHAYLLHGVLGFDSLWAGAWYVAIDFQLFVMLALMLALARAVAAPQWRAAATVMMAMAAVAASLFWFNLDGDWDNWAPYFFGSYGMGVLAWWAVSLERRAAFRILLPTAILLLGGLALEWTFRSRIATAMAVALLLVAAYRSGLQLLDHSRHARLSAALAWLGQRSYAIFLVHFSVCMLVNGYFTAHGAPTAAVQGLGMLLAWLGSLGAGALFHRWIELPLAKRFNDRASASASAKLQSLPSISAR